ncbi:hypothetical protein ACERIT_08270 [Halopenitus sp. H-Gu1]|uniref:hypothetical protein n=1 Tax=Halopenitus sp. H-Gu1 TaxID=3242697 RepID=UPI00359D016E
MNGNRSNDRSADPISALALPFVIGMAIGLSLGRFLGGPLVGIAVGLVLFATLGWLRLKLARLPQ